MTIKTYSLLSLVGKPLAITICMIQLTIQLNVGSEKRMELSQKITSLSDSTMMEEECRDGNFSQSIEDEKRFFLIEEWDTRENRMDNMKSDQFNVLRGVMNLLEDPYETMFHTIFSKVNGMKSVNNRMTIE
jgi:quinol monooxygenase YgiN